MKSDDAALPTEQRDPSSRRGGARDETRNRTRDLISDLTGATTARRATIREEVVVLHLGLAVSAARRYGAASEFDDLVQVARIGLVEAFDRFDPGQGSYSNFAWLTMTGLLRRHLRDHGWSVRPPRLLQESANQLRKAMPDLTQDLGRTPSTTEMAGHLGWAPSAVREARLADQALRAASLEPLVGEGWVREQPAEGDVVETRLVLSSALQALTEEERDLIRLRFFDDLTQIQIGTVLGVSQMQVSRLLTRLMRKLRTEIGELDESPGKVAQAPRAAAAPR